MKRFVRLGWSVGDQAISSVSNLLLSVLLARNLDLNAFGAFGLAYAAYQIMIGVSRSTIGEPTLIRSSGRLTDDVGIAGEHRSVIGSSLILGFASGAVSAFIALLSPADIAPAFWALAISLPGLMVLDGARYWSFARQQARTAVYLDASWLVVQLLLFFALISFGQASLLSLITAWGCGALLASAIYLAVQKMTPSIIGGFRWFVRNRDMSPGFLGEYLTVSGVQQGLVLFTLSFAGLAAVGSLRAAQTIMGPMNVISMGVAVVALPALSRRAETRLRSFPRLSLIISTSLALPMVVVGAAVLFVPTDWGVFLLGDSWLSGKDLVPLVAAVLAVSSLSYGATAALRAMQQLKASFALRVITAPLVLVAIGIGAAMGGNTGALLGAIAGGLGQCVAWWILYIRIWRRSVKAGNS